MAEPLSLLLIEDDEDTALLMRMTLERAGHRVTVCHSVEAALIVLGHGSFDLITLNHILPGVTGIDSLQTLNREGSNTPVIMVTGFDDECLAAQALRAGALDFIFKDAGLKFLTELPERVSKSVMRFRSR